jgi:hypothetical protein
MDPTEFVKPLSEVLPIAASPMMPMRGALVVAYCATCCKEHATKASDQALLRAITFRRGREVAAAIDLIACYPGMVQRAASRVRSEAPEVLYLFKDWLARLC